MTRIVSGMVVDAERMKRNLELTGGLVYSQGVLLALVRAGMEREKAYEVVQKKALESWDTKKPLKDLLLQDRQVVEKLSKEGIERCFDPAAVLSRTDEIFKRALGGS